MGGTLPDETSSNNQDNLCVNRSDCSNSCMNNQNICAHGASCNNAGEDTTVISVATNCDNGPYKSPRVCQSSRTLTFEK